MLVVADARAEPARPLALPDGNCQGQEEWLRGSSAVPPIQPLSS